MSKLSLTDNLREVYTKRYPEDELGPDINPALTIGALKSAVESGRHVYRVLQVWDSLVREHCFVIVSEAAGEPYDKIYEAWLGSNVD